MTAQRNTARILAGSIAAATAAALLAGCTSSEARDTPSRSSLRASPFAEQSSEAASYRDGTYEATGWYGGLPSHQDVTLTVEDDRITDVTVSTPAEDPTSLRYQRAFAAAVPAAVVGRRIDEVQIDRLAGASGCPDGFMDALEQIKDDAAA